MQDVTFLEQRKKLRFFIWLHVAGIIPWIGMFLSPGFYSDYSGFVFLFFLPLLAFTIVPFAIDIAHIGKYLAHKAGNTKAVKILVAIFLILITPIIAIFASDFFIFAPVVIVFTSLVLLLRKYAIDNGIIQTILMLIISIITSSILCVVYFFLTDNFEALNPTPFFWQFFSYIK